MFYDLGGIDFRHDLGFSLLFKGRLITFCFSDEHNLGECFFWGILKFWVLFIIGNIARLCKPSGKSKLRIYFMCTSI